MSLKIGVHTGPQNTSYQDLSKLWRLTDSSGFHWISIWDHFYDNPSPDGKGDCFEAVSALTALAAETKNVRVGALVFGIPYRNPAVLAKSAVTIDHISNGRLELGIGGGWYEKEFEAYGIPFLPVKLRLDALEEGAQIIKSMLTQEETTFHGQHFTVEKAYCFPRPVQRPPRLWIGGLGEKRTLRIAARYADGWNAAYISPELFKAKSRVLDQWCEAENRDPSQIERSVNVGFYLGIDEASAQRLRSQTEETWKDDPQRLGGMLFGTHNEVIDRIGQYTDAGAQGLNIAIRAPFDFDTFQCFIDDVMSAFKD